jgi:putative membrane protein
LVVTVAIRGTIGPYAMLILFFVASAFAALIHLYIFVLESLLWGTPRANGVFGVTKEQAASQGGFAFNQGFYNLFLAVGASAGAVLVALGQLDAGTGMSLVSLGSMLGAAIVLVASYRRLWRAALIQGGPPLMALLGLIPSLVG